MVRKQGTSPIVLGSPAAIVDASGLDADASPTLPWNQAFHAPRWNPDPDSGDPLRNPKSPADAVSSFPPTSASLPGLSRVRTSRWEYLHLPANSAEGRCGLERIRASIEGQPTVAAPLTLHSSEEPLSCAQPSRSLPGALA